MNPSQSPDAGNRAPAGDQAIVARDFLDEVYAPIDLLLTAGGDGRLKIDPLTKLNVYGCSPRSRPEALSFSSSTASSISERAYEKAVRARARFIEDSSSTDLVEYFDRHIEHTRGTLRMYLELQETDAEVVFSPSGTDSQLHALYFAKLALGNPITTIVVGSDQTGSGTIFTSRGRYFADETARKLSVTKGSPISGLADGTENVNIPLFAPDGTMRSDAEIDATVLNEVGSEIDKGRRVLLQAMDSSKLGWRAPTDQCLREICDRWPSSVMIAVDACQMRLGRARIREYVRRGYLVLITGSKFFTGPSFCGATLVPKKLSKRIATMDIFPSGLSDYADRSDLPFQWTRLRSQMTAAPNFGQWLRWKAALEEMRAYYALPSSYRRSCMMRMASTIEAQISSSRLLRLIPNRGERSSDGIDDEEMGIKTIFSFLIRRDDAFLAPDDVSLVYRTLNRDISSLLPSESLECSKAVASQLCHIGQPVAFPLGHGTSTAVLRIGIGARMLSDSWSSDQKKMKKNILDVANQIGLTVAKIELAVEHLELIQRSFSCSIKRSETRETLPGDVT